MYTSNVKCLLLVLYLSEMYFAFITDETAGVDEYKPIVEDLHYNDVKIKLVHNEEMKKKCDHACECNLALIYQMTN